MKQYLAALRNTKFFNKLEWKLYHFFQITLGRRPFCFHKLKFQHSLNGGRKIYECVKCGVWK